MKRTVAKKLDILLNELADFSEEGFTLDTIISNFCELELTEDEFKTALAVFRADKLIEPIFHPEVPDYDMGFFGISEKGIKFINFDGGYEKKRKNEFYERSNVRFTFIRHWFWFLGFLISLSFNIYLVIKLYFKLMN